MKGLSETVRYIATPNTALLVTTALNKSKMLYETSLSACNEDLTQGASSVLFEGTVVRAAPSGNDRRLGFLSCDSSQHRLIFVDSP